MKTPNEWAMRAAIVTVPWAHPERSDRYLSLFDAVLNAGPAGRSASPWIVLEDGRMLTPAQILELRRTIYRGSIAEVPDL